MGNITWQAPSTLPAGVDPSVRAAQYELRKRVAQACKDNPGEWAVLHKYDKRDTATTTASLITRGLSPAFGTGFQGASRRTGDNEWTIYVKWLEP